MEKRIVAIEYAGLFIMGKLIDMVDDYLIVKEPLSVHIKVVPTDVKNAKGNSNLAIDVKMQPLLTHTTIIKDNLIKIKKDAVMYELNELNDQIVDLYTQYSLNIFSGIITGKNSTGKIIQGKE